MAGTSPGDSLKAEYARRATQLTIRMHTRENHISTDPLGQSPAREPASVYIHRLFEMWPGVRLRLGTYESRDGIALVH